MSVGQPLHFEAWDDFECAGGSRLAVLGDVADAEIHEALDGTDELTLTLPYEDGSTASMASRKVVRLLGDAGFREWRIRDLGRQGRADGGLLRTLTCEGPLYDLMARGALLRRQDASGVVVTDFEIRQRTPAEHLSLILGGLSPYLSGAPSYFAAGTVDFTDPVDVLYRHDTPLSALRELVTAIGGGAELAVRRNGTSGYLVDIVAAVGSSAATVLLSPGANVASLSESSSAEKQATEVTPLGADDGAGPFTMAAAAWTVASVAGNTVTFEEALLGEDDQLVGAYLERSDGALTEVTGSAAPSDVTVADATGVAAGQVLSFRADAAGSELISLQSPAAVASYGVIPQALERTDIPAVDNLAPNPMLDDWSGGSLVSVATVGAPTITEETDDLYVQSGSASARVAGSEGEGLAMVPVTVSPTADSPYFTAEASLWIVSGSVKVLLVDNTNAEYWPKDTAAKAQVTSETGRWIGDLAVSPGENFQARGTTELLLQVVAAEDGTEFILDAWQLIQSDRPAGTFYHGRASNDLWYAALDRLSLVAQPLESWDLGILDRSRIDAATYPDEDLEVGGPVRLVAHRLDIDVSSRVQDHRFDPFDPSRTQIQLETEKDRLTKLLAVTDRRRRIREPERPDQVNRPADVTGFSATYGKLLQASWDAARGAWGYEIRLQGSGGTALARWASGTRLGTTQGTKITLTAAEVGVTTADLSIRAYNSSGRESRNPAELTVVQDLSSDAVDITPKGSITLSPASPEAAQPFTVTVTLGADGTGPGQFRWWLESEVIDPTPPSGWIASGTQQLAMRRAFDQLLVVEVRDHGAGDVQGDDLSIGIRGFYSGRTSPWAIPLGPGERQRDGGLGGEVPLDTRVATRIMDPTRTDTWLDALTGRFGSGVAYSDGDTLLGLKPAEGGATLGATWGTNLTHQPANTRNLVNHGSFEDDAVGGGAPGLWVGSSTLDVASVTGQTGFTRALKVTAPSSGYGDVRESLAVPVRGGETLYADFWASAAGAPSAASISFGVRWTDTSGAHGWPGVSITPGSGWTHYTGFLTAAADAVSAQPYLVYHQGGAAGEYVLLADMHLYQGTADDLARQAGSSAPLSGPITHLGDGGDATSEFLVDGGSPFRRLFEKAAEHGAHITYGSNYTNPASTVYLGDGVTLPSGTDVLRLKTYDQSAGGVYVMAAAESGGTEASHDTGFTSVRDGSGTSDVVLTSSGSYAYANLGSADGGACQVTVRYEVDRSHLASGESITVYAVTIPSGSSTATIRGTRSYGAGSGSISDTMVFSASLASGDDAALLVSADVDALTSWSVTAKGSASSPNGVTYITFGSPTVTAITSATAMVLVRTEEAA